MSVGSNLADGQGKKEKGNCGSTGESDRGKRGRIRAREKYKKKNNSSFINAVSIHYRCIYAILTGIRYCLGRQ